MQTIYIDKPKISIPYQVIGFLFFGTLIFFCAYYYKERMLLFDGAFYDFRLITDGFNVGPGRYGDLVGELLPWLACRLGAPLWLIVMSHSVGLMLFHYAIFLFITLKLKNNGAGLAVMLASCLAYAHAFYIPFLQVNEAIVLGVLLWAFIHPETPYSTTRDKMWGTIGALLTIVIMSFFHPLSIFLIAFVLGLEATAFKRYLDKQIWIIGIAGLAWFALKFQILFPNHYEQDKIVPLSTIIHELHRFWEWPSTMFLLRFIDGRFRSLKILAIICLLLTLRKGIMFFLFTVLITALFTIIFMGTYYKGTSVLVYEDYFTIYGFFIAVLFCSLFYHPGRRNLVLLISLPLLWLGIGKIHYSHYQFTYRLNYLSRIIQDAHKEHMKKCLIDKKCYPESYADAEWDVAFETLLYSSFAGPDSSVTVFINTPAVDSLVRANKDKPNTLFGVNFSPLWYTSNSIPEKYMVLPAAGYTSLTHSQKNSGFHDSLFSSKSIKITPLVQTIHAKVNDWVVVIPLKIENNSGIVIPAIPKDTNSAELCYTLYDSEGVGLSHYLPTSFEMDIKNELVCGVTIYLPFQKGRYFVKPDIITSDKYFWNLSCPFITIIVD